MYLARVDLQIQIQLQIQIPSQGIRVYNTCLVSISPEPISNTRMFIYFMYCMLIIMHPLQGSVMEQPLYKDRPRP
jgi:hypothetical protein